MKTLLTTSAEEAAEIIRKGGTVAFPTETVYGLGANVFDANAVAAIFEAKKRPADNPLIAHVANLDQVRNLASEVGPTARKLIAAFFPGPLTLVLPRSERVPSIATAGLDTIGVRMPRHELARQFLSACGVPVVAPSANISGKPSPTTWRAVLEDLDGRIDCILQGEATEIGVESTVVDCSTESPVLLRQGAISLEELRQIEPSIEEYAGGGDADRRSPGLRHRHYSPSARVIIVDLASEGVSDPRSAYIGINVPPAEFGLSRICDSVDAYARSVFEFFRECDRAGIERIYCEAVAEVGIGQALMDRLRRAAEG